MVWKASWIWWLRWTSVCRAPVSIPTSFADGDLVRKDDMNTSDMHPFIHPLSAAVDPAWEAKSDWEIYKAIAKKFSEVCVGHLGKETDIVTLPIQHDSAAELAQPLDVKDWKKASAT